VRQPWDEVYDWAGLRVRSLVTLRYPRPTPILDVGAGQGKYRTLLPEYPNVDACEIWEPTVHEYDLPQRYRNVFVCDVYDMLLHLRVNDLREYGVMIFGDVLEHLDRERAQESLRNAYAVCPDVIVVVPYMYPQDAHDGNEYQRHLQDDLTPELMSEAYPELRLVDLESRNMRPFKGLYRALRGSTR